MKHPSLLAIPANAAILLLRAGGVHLCRPLRSGEFVKFAKERGITIDAARLLRLERLGIFSPLFRVYNSNARTPLRLPLITNNWFRKGYAVDTSNGQPHEVPENFGAESEAYYSKFQIASLLWALADFTVPIHLENLLDGSELNETAWLERGAEMRRIADMHAERYSTGNQFRPAIDLLCQFISDRYYPYTRSNQRSRIVSEGGFASDKWMTINGTHWKWEPYARSWDPKYVAKVFNLTSDKLKHAFEALSTQQSWDDPLDHWHQLVQFVSPRERDRLKGKALAAETMRGGALMLGMLYRDLYGAEPGHPNEVRTTIITHVPELAARADVRRHMEFVVNRFDLNPAPKLTLFVEGASEEVAAKMVFERFFGAPAGTHQIEIIDLGGVDNATGGKKADRFRAILRLVDYLHHHQTFTFLILDNENYAQKLKDAAKDLASTLHSNRHATRPEYIKVWRTSFEFDNFSATEIAKAMTALANGVVFKSADVAACKKGNNPGAELSALYRARTNSGINKVNLASKLVEMIFDPSSRKALHPAPYQNTGARRSACRAQSFSDHGRKLGTQSALELLRQSAYKTWEKA
ncbi:hypothetical protein ILFOPFJJ_06657 [Ensifer psoraleae]|uniref:hypothetical protein n=1 Tax=Sinorhizobium psoraleae TaxID=520838 RepID=UPI001569E49D|nr:hypothetical protein [Sinorhizobium psoraleae]NRP75734.1 hypothetical protein [Sinorhizobium psoraleae]